MKKFLNNFAGVSVLSAEEQKHIKGAAADNFVCTGRHMACAIDADCPMVCLCLPNEAGWKYCEDKQIF